MKIIFEWEITLPLLLTFIGMLGSYIFTLISNYKNKKEKKIQALENIYSEAIYLLNYPFKLSKTPESYSNDNEYIQKSVRRRIKDYQLELDDYWSYYCKEPYPDLENLSSSEKEKLIPLIDNEYDSFMRKSVVPEHNIFSPAFYISDDLVNEKLQHIYSYISKHKSSFDKNIREFVDKALENSPKEVKAKYEHQLSYEYTYFHLNEPSFVDPYWQLLINIRNQYDKYTTSLARRLMDYLQFKYVLLRSRIFRKIKETA